MNEQRENLNENEEEKEKEKLVEKYAINANSGKSQSTERKLQEMLAQQKKLLGQDLNKEERDVIDCFERPRMLLQRIYIVYNQTRHAMGVDLISEKEIRNILESLKDKGYVRIEKFNYQGEDREAFILTENGKQLLE
ncbi:MAG: hypothetical protein ACTSRZ_16595 [Promethearchaeota archaeon]